MDLEYERERFQKILDNMTPEEFDDMLEKCGMIPDGKVAQMKRRIKSFFEKRSKNEKR